MSKKWWLVAFVEFDPPMTKGGCIVRSSGAYQAVQKVARLNLIPPGLAACPVGELRDKLFVKAQETDVALTDAQLDEIKDR